MEQFKTFGQKGEDSASSFLCGKGYGLRITGKAACFPVFSDKLPLFRNGKGIAAAKAQVIARKPGAHQIHAQVMGQEFGDYIVARTESFEFRQMLMGIDEGQRFDVLINFPDHGKPPFLPLILRIPEG